MISKIKSLVAIVIICACLPFAGQAQMNLVKNGGFEDYIVCPYAQFQVKAARYWSAPDTDFVSPSFPYIGPNDCSAIYLNSCSTDPGSAVPHSSACYQWPHSGNGMMNARMYTDLTWSPGQRSYFTGRLSSPLVAGQSYCVTFYLVLATFKDGYGIDHIGAYLDDGSIDTSTQCGMPRTYLTPQVVGTTIITDTLHWTKIQGSFVANGTEKYITIGNFADMAGTNTVLVNPSGGESFYEVDDVSVIATSANAYAGPDATIYAGQSTDIGVQDSSGGGVPGMWYELGVAIPIDSGGTISVHPTTTTSYVVEMDLCGMVTYDTVQVTVLPCPALAAAYTETGNLTKTFTYNGTTTLVDSVRWSFGDGGTATGMAPVHTYTASGAYHVCVTAYTVCDTDSVCHEVVVSANAVTPLTPEGGPSIWPNPVSDQLHIDGASLSEVVIMDVLGRVVYKGKLSLEHEVVSLSSLGKGLYVVMVVDKSGERYVKRIIKE